MYQLVSTVLTVHVKSYVNPPAADESSKKTTEEENVSLGDIMHETNLIGAAMTEEGPVSHDFSQSAPVELPVRPLHVTSSVLPAALATVAHSEEWDEQVAIDFAMGLPLSDSEVHSADDIRAYDIAVMFDFYNKYEDVDDQERFGEPCEGFHSYVYKMVGLNANGEETIAADEEEDDSSGDEFDSDEDEDGDDQSEFGEEEIDRASFIGDDDKEEEEEWDEHDYSEAELDADEGVSLSGKEETEIELEGEDQSTRWTLA